MGVITMALVFRRATSSGFSYADPDDLYASLEPPRIRNLPLHEFPFAISIDDPSRGTPGAN